MADIGTTFNSPFTDPVSSFIGNAPAQPSAAPEPSPSVDVKASPAPVAEPSPEQKIIQLGERTKRGYEDLGQKYLKATQPAMKEIAEGIKAESDIAIDKERTLNESNRVKSQTIAEAYKQEAEAIRTSQEYNDYEKVINELQKQEFVPTKENAQDLAQLFTYISLVGFGIGKGGRGSAQAAMSAMTGMMEGHMKGRDDLYKREKDIFETNIKLLKDKAEYIDKKLKKIIELAATDRTAAERMADELFYETNATFYKDIKDKQGLMIAGKIAEKNLELMNKAFDISLKQFEATQKVQEQLAMLGIKQDLELGPFLREFSKQYPQGTTQRLYGASKEDKDRIYNSSQQITQTEEVAKYIMDNPKTVSALASAKNFINLDAIRSLNSNEYELADEKSALVDQQLDDAVKNGKLSVDDAQSAKVLQKKLFSLALSDVRGSGQRGSIYLDKQFQKIYDQASRPKTLIDILGQREHENNNNLAAYQLGIENNIYKSNYPLFNEGAAQFYKNRAPQPPQEVIDFFTKNPNKTSVKIRNTDMVYVREGNKIYEE